MSAKKPHLIDLPLPAEYYSVAAKSGKVRRNRKSIALSKNVVELQPYACVRALHVFGEKELARVCEYWANYGYINL